MKNLKSKTHLKFGSKEPKIKILLHLTETK